MGKNELLLIDKKESVLYEIDNCQKLLTQKEEVILIEKTELQKKEKSLKRALTWKKIAYVPFLLICLILLNFEFENSSRRIEVSHNETEINEVEEKIDTYVCFTTDYGDCYHARNCKHLWNSSYETNVYLAKKAGYLPCDDCTPREQIIYTATIPKERLVTINEWVRDPVINKIRIFEAVILLINIYLFVIHTRITTGRCDNNYKHQVEVILNLEKETTQVENSLEKLRQDLVKADEAIENYHKKHKKYTDGVKGKRFLEYIGLTDDLLFNTQGRLIGTKENPNKYCCYIASKGSKYHVKYECVAVPLVLISVGEALQKHRLACTRCTNGKEPYWVLKVESNLKNAIEEFDKYDVDIPDRGYWIYPSMTK